MMTDEGDTDGAVDSTVDLVLELENIANETEESLSSTTVTSLPVADGPSASEATPTSRVDGDVHVGFVVRAEKVFCSVCLVLVLNFPFLDVRVL